MYLVQNESRLEYGEAAILEVSNMHMWFDLFAIKGNIYKKLIKQLCQASDSIYFTCSMEYTIDEGIPELSGRCEQVSIPSDIRQWCNGDVVGYKIDGQLIQYLYTYDNLNELLGDRMSDENKTIFFCRQDEEIAHIFNTMEKLIYIVTNDNAIMEEFSVYGHAFINSYL